MNQIFQILLFGFIASIIVTVIFYGIFYGISKLLGWKFEHRNHSTSIFLLVCFIFILNALGTILRNYQVSHKTIAIIYFILGLIISVIALIRYILSQKK